MTHDFLKTPRSLLVIVMFIGVTIITSFSDVQSAVELGDEDTFSDTRTISVGALTVAKVALSNELTSMPYHDSSLSISFPSNFMGIVANWEGQGDSRGYGIGSFSSSDSAGHAQFPRVSGSNSYGWPQIGLDNAHSQQRSLLPADIVDGDRRIEVGDGRVKIFDQNGVQQGGDILTNPADQMADVQVDGDRITVVDHGSVRVFDRNGNQIDGTITTTPANGKATVVLGGSSIVVVEQGQVTVFDRDMNQQGGPILTSPADQKADVQIDGDRIIVTSAGSIRVFDQNGNQINGTIMTTPANENGTALVDGQSIVIVENGQVTIFNRNMTQQGGVILTNPSNTKAEVVIEGDQIKVTDQNGTRTFDRMGRQLAVNQRSGDFIIGDANLDGTFSSADITVVQAFISGSIDLSGDQIERADVAFPCGGSLDPMDAFWLEYALSALQWGLPSASICSSGFIGSKPFDSSGPPFGDPVPVSVEVALDINGNDKLDEEELTIAIKAWINGFSIPNANETISDQTILELVRLWVTGGESLSKSRDEFLSSSAAS